MAQGDLTLLPRDPFHPVVRSGNLLNIEFRGRAVEGRVGEVDWAEQCIRPAVNVGKEDFEEIVTFFLDCAEAEPQSEEEV
ncbi:MAG TPA: hypothetical protein VEI01_19520 [Terriglobales bacterium]|nr:hypothetical protein [Terriglobales bacterium]